MIKTCALQLSGLIGDTADDISDEEYEYQDNIESYDILMNRIITLITEFVGKNKQKKYTDIIDEIKLYKKNTNVNTLFEIDSTSKEFILKSILSHQRPSVEGSTNKWDKNADLKSTISEPSSIDE